MSNVNALDKKKTERSQVSVSTAFNDAKLRKSPSGIFPRDGSMASAVNVGSGTSAAKSPRGKVIIPITINKLSQSQQEQSQQRSQRLVPSVDKPPSSPQSSPDQAEAPAPVTPGDAAPLNLSPGIGLKIEFGLGLIAASITLGLWIFLATRDCYEKPDMVFWVKTFAILGTVAGLFVSVYCCFERSISPARGLASCLYITFLAMVGGLNLVGAYLATTCICTCGKSALTDKRKDDLTIFVLEILGGICILGVILVASLTRPMA